MKTDLKNLYCKQLGFDTTSWKKLQDCLKLLKRLDPKKFRLPKSLSKQKCVKCAHNIKRIYSMAVLELYEASAQDTHLNSLTAKAKRKTLLSRYLSLYILPSTTLFNFITH